MSAGSGTVEKLYTWASPTGPRTSEGGVGMLRMKKGYPETPEMPKNLAKLGKLPTGDLEVLLETSLSRTAELFRGLSHREIETPWVLQQMETEILQALATVQVLQRRVED